MEDPMKELEIDAGRTTGEIEVSGEHTLADVRNMINEEWDPHMLPDKSEAFDFFVNGKTQISSKQEKRKRVWDLMDRNKKLCIRARKSSQNHQPQSGSKGELMPPEQVARASQREDTLDRSNDPLDSSNSIGPVISRNEENDANEQSCRATKEQNRMSNSNTEQPETTVSFSTEEMDYPCNQVNCASSDLTKPNNATLLGIDSDTDMELDTEVELDIDASHGNDANVTTSDLVYGTDVFNSSIGDDGLHLHSCYQRSIKQSQNVLSELTALLQDDKTKAFHSQESREKWQQEINETYHRSEKDLVIGLFGVTGAGKSSLLNALLGERAASKTSGSKGCTAVVTECRCNVNLSQLSQYEANCFAPRTVFVYEGQVEFVSPEDWLKELELLLELCSEECNKTGKKIFRGPPANDGRHDSDRAAAWSKLAAVYVEDHVQKLVGGVLTNVHFELSTDSRLKTLLKPTDGFANRRELFKEGVVGAEDAQLLMGETSKLPFRLRHSREQWAAAFASKLSTYIHHTDDEKVPQTWPLIQTVVRAGPWPVLSTGACLVDLPGVRDNNAARAKVAETYLKKCDQIWICARISRAVDDGIAQELISEQFKRRLLMDGQWGNVVFIATCSDDCKSTEIIADHEEVARRVEGRWEKMRTCHQRIANIKDELLQISREKENLRDEFVRSLQSANDISAALDDAHGMPSRSREMNSVLSQEKQKAPAIKAKLRELRGDQKTHQKTMKMLRQYLKIICAAVRSDYTTSSLQASFINDLKADDNENDEGVQSFRVPEDFRAPVFACSANDFLKLEGIEDSSNGPPATFSAVNQTGIPALKAFVHRSTASRRETFAKSVCEATSNILDRLRLLAADIKVDGFEDAHDVFDAEMLTLANRMGLVAADFRRKAHGSIAKYIVPCLRSAATKGNAAIVSTVKSWGSTSYRTRYERPPNKTGLRYLTMKATLKHKGVFSSSVGLVDLNQELCNPFEVETTHGWQQVVLRAATDYFAEATSAADDICKSVLQNLSKAYYLQGMDPLEVSSMEAVAKNSCKVALDSRHKEATEKATKAQRELNRTLVPMVSQTMKTSYLAALYHDHGSGARQRMVDMLVKHAEKNSLMFDKIAKKLHSGIEDYFAFLSTLVLSLQDDIRQSLEHVYCIFWEDGSKKPSRELVQKCRKQLSPGLTELRRGHTKTMNMLGYKYQDVLTRTTGDPDKAQRDNGNMRSDRAAGTVTSSAASFQESTNRKAHLDSPTKNAGEEKVSNLVSVSQPNNPVSALGATTQLLSAEANERLQKTVTNMLSGHVVSCTPTDTGMRAHHEAAQAHVLAEEDTNKTKARIENEMPSSATTDTEMKANKAKAKNDGITVSQNGANAQAFCRAQIPPENTSRHVYTNVQAKSPAMPAWPGQGQTPPANANANRHAYTYVHGLSPAMPVWPDQAQAPPANANANADRHAYTNAMVPTPMSFSGPSGPSGRFYPPLPWFYPPSPPPPAAVARQDQFHSISSHNTERTTAKGARLETPAKSVTASSSSKAAPMTEGVDGATNTSGSCKMGSNGKELHLPGSYPNTTMKKGSRMETTLKTVPANSMSKVPPMAEGVGGPGNTCCSSKEGTNGKAAHIPSPYPNQTTENGARMETTLKSVTLDSISEVPPVPEGIDEARNTCGSSKECSSGPDQTTGKRARLETTLKSLPASSINKAPPVTEAMGGPENTCCSSKQGSISKAAHLSLKVAEAASIVNPTQEIRDEKVASKEGPTVVSSGADNAVMK